jgi:hypothetical protein
MSIIYDQMAEDLARKCADDVRDAMWRTILLSESEGQRAAIAMMAAASASAITAGIVAKLIGFEDVEAVADALWEQMRPRLIRAIVPPRSPRTDEGAAA